MWEQKYHRNNSKLQDLTVQKAHLDEQLEKANAKISKLQRENTKILDLILELRSPTSKAKILLQTADQHIQQSLTSKAVEEKTEQPRPVAKKRKRDSRKNAKDRKELAKDEHGNIILPVTVRRFGSDVTIRSLGTVVYDRDAYHTNRFIWPVGYHSEKQYQSLVDTSGKTTYTSKIVDGGDAPSFEVTVQDMPDEVFRAASASGAWKKVLIEMNNRGITGPKTNVSGPDFFGLSDLGVISAIQELPNASKCAKYVMQKWTTDLPETPSNTTTANSSTSKKPAAESTMKPITESTEATLKNTSANIENSNTSNENEQTKEKDTSKGNNDKTTANGDDAEEEEEDEDDDGDNDDDEEDEGGGGGEDKMAIDS